MGGCASGPNAIAEAAGAEVYGKPVEVDVDRSVGALLLAAALMLETDPELKTPRDIRRRAEADAKVLAGMIQKLREWAERNDEHAIRGLTGPVEW